MKKRLMSKFLMGALVVLTMGVFSSCKDYDDDINANTALIKDLQSQVDKLEQAKSALQSDLAAANSAIAAAQAAADKAAADLVTAKKDLQDAIAAAQANLEASIAAAQKAAIDEAQKRIDAATTDLQAAIAAGDQAAIEEAQKRIDEATAKLTAALNETKGELENKITAAQQAAIEEAQKRIDTATAQVKTYAQEIAAQEAAAAAAQVKIEIINELNAKVTELNAAIDKKLSKDEFNTILATLATKEGLNEALKPIIDDIAKLQESVSGIGEIKSKLDELYADAVRKGEFNTALATLSDEILATVGEQYLTIADFQDFLDNEFAGVLAALYQTITQVGINTEAILALDGAVGQLDEAVADIIASMATKEYLAETLANYATADDLLAAKIFIQQWVNGLGFQTKEDVDALIQANNVTMEALIDQVNTKLNTKVAELTSLIGQCAKTSDLNALKTELTNKMSEINNIVNGTNGLVSRVGAIEGELGALQAALNDIVNNILNDFPDLNTEESSLGANATSNTNTLATVLTAMANRISELGNYVSSTFAAVQANLDNITLFVTKNLTSLVYRPEVGSEDVAYLYGFPIIRAYLLEPQEVFTFSFANNDDKVTSSGNVTKQFDIIAKYWLNPSSTDISLYNWQFDEVAGKNVITRGKQDTKLAGVGAKVIEVEEKGILTVALTLKDGANVNDAMTVTEGKSSYAWLTTVALQAVRNDKDINSKDTVTSDYAVLVPDYIKDLLLANNEFEKDTHIEGNQEFHLRTKYSELDAENKTGVYSYQLAYNDEEAVVDLTTIDVHFDNGTPDKGVMTHKDAENRGFTFKYTILTDKDYFALDAENQTIAVAKNENTSVGKVANVRVELQADGKTFAYGYISIIITSPTVTVNIDMDELVIKCPDPIATSLKWADVKKKIEDAIGVPGAFDNYDWVQVAENIDKFQPGTDKKDDKKGIISQDANNFSWTFTEAEIKAVFYDNLMKPAAKEYKTSIHLTPKDGHPELANVVVNVTIKNEIYPTGEFSYDQRIQQYWFNKESTKIAETAEDRYEIHGNVEVVDQPDADDEFFFNISASFFNSKFDQTGYEDPDAILIYDTHKFNYADLATVYFDAEKYYIYNAAHANKTIAEMKSIAPATSFAKGMSGTEYLLYIADRDSKVLMAVKDKLDEATAQPVVELSGTYNNVATYQGWTYFDGSNKDDFAYAYDLLNKNDHNEVGAGETFTTHMMLDQRDYCFPIDFSENEAFKFDIRYLRPISVDEQDNHIITDAVDGGTIIKLAEHAGFIDWRDIKFSAKLRWKYINYYGIRAIKPNLDKAVTDINGGWTNIKYFPLLQFEDLTTEGSGEYTSGQDFIDQLGYVKYTNNGLNVGSFTIKMPITLLYDWGETAEQWITFTIYRTQGQDINARQK